MDSIKMLKLKKIRGSSLVETLIATVVIMIVFGIAMATVSNVLERTVRSNSRLIENKLTKLEYLYRNDKIQVPDQVEFQNWLIDIAKEKEGEINFVVFTATHKINSKEKSRKVIE
jgi:Tfp pilus assembly protein PilE